MQKKTAEKKTHISHRPLNKGPRKQFQQDGHWIVKPNKTQILVCTCGNKYIKTRPSQVVCIRCLYNPPKH